MTAFGADIALVPKNVLDDQGRKVPREVIVLANCGCGFREVLVDSGLHYLSEKVVRKLADDKLYRCLDITADALLAPPGPQKYVK